MESRFDLGAVSDARWRSGGKNGRFGFYLDVGFSGALVVIGLLGFSVAARSEWVAGLFWQDLPDWAGLGAFLFGFVALNLWLTVTRKGKPAISLDVDHEGFRALYANGRTAQVRWSDRSLSLTIQRNRVGPADADLVRTLVFRWRAPLWMTEDACNAVVESARTAGLTVTDVRPTSWPIDDQIRIVHRA